MKRTRIIRKSIFLLFLPFFCVYGQISIGADLVSRYVWRGQDFGNSASIQPDLSYALGSFTVGVWGSYALTSSGAGFNENDLYISYAFNQLNLRFTDYYYPENNNLFEFSPDSGYHILELSLSYIYHNLDILFAVNLFGDLNDQAKSRNSVYSEARYKILSRDEINVHLFAGTGNEVYLTMNKNNFALINLGINVNKEKYNLSYIINPEAETSFLVFRINF